MFKPAWCVLAFALAAGALGGCRSLGYNDQSANNALTPNLDEKVYVRTWGPDKGGGAPQTVTKSAPAAASADPAYPGYTGPAKSPAPAPAAPAAATATPGA